MYGFIYVLCGLLLLDFGPRFSMYFYYGIVTRRVVYHRHNSFLVVARFYFFYNIYRCSIFFKKLLQFILFYFLVQFLCIKILQWIKKKKLTLQYLLLYIVVIYLGVEDLKTRRKTKQPEPRMSTVRTLGVDWAAHGKPKPWWAAHGSLVWPNGLRMAAPLWGGGLCTPMGEGRRMGLWLMGHLKILYS